MDPDADLRELVRDYGRLQKLDIDISDPAAMAGWAADLKVARAKIAASVLLRERGAMAIEIICSRKRS